jgi:PAS domain S-box-containing protein
MTTNNTYEDAEKIRICQGDIDYQGIVKHINDGVVIIREGNIVFANSVFYEMSQKSPDQVIGRDFSDFISHADREEVVTYCTERLFSTTLSDRIEFTMPRAEGEAIIEMKVSVVECGGSPSILAALTDISERRKTRLELEKIKGRLQSILHSMNELVVSFSPEDYAILSINPAAEALYGAPLRDFTSGRKHILRFVHPDDKEKVEQFYRNLPEAEFDEAQYRIVSSTKKVKWVLDEGHIVYSNKGAIRRIDHVIRDITEEKKTIDALKQSEAKYRDFFESTNEMAYAVTPQGIFIDINEAGLKLLGFENKEEALASNLKNFYVDLAERTELLTELREKGLVEGKQVKFKNKAGDVIEVAVTARAKTDDSGDVLYYEGIAHNLTKALEDQRNRVLRNAAGGMCHYLNTHLMQLDGSKDVLAEEMKSLDALIDRLAQGEHSQDIADQMKLTMESMHHFLEGIKGAYERISEVTRAFNKAFLYKEESYATGTILDIFKAHGYEGEDSNQESFS